MQWFLHIVRWERNGMSKALILANVGMLFIARNTSHQTTSMHVEEVILFTRFNPPLPHLYFGALMQKWYSSAYMIGTEEP